MKLIDADLFLEEIRKGATVEDLKKLVTECKGVPVTVDAEPVKHGKWEVIKRGQIGYNASDFKCSICGTPNRCYSLTNHCAHCGAKMDKD